MDLRCGVIKHGRQREISELNGGLNGKNIELDGGVSSKPCLIASRYITSLVQGKISRGMLWIYQEIWAAVASDESSLKFQD